MLLLQARYHPMLLKPMTGKFIQYPVTTRRVSYARLMVVCRTRRELQRVEAEMNQGRWLNLGPWHPGIF
jgi:hypothetical protein